VEIVKRARPTLTAVELNGGDHLLFVCSDGTEHRLELESTRAGIHETTLAKPRVAEHGARTVLRIHTGSHEHSHFVFGVVEPGAEEAILLDPWILFRQMYEDREATTARRRGWSRVPAGPTPPCP